MSVTLKLPTGILVHRLNHRRLCTPFCALSACTPEKTGHVPPYKFLPVIVLGLLFLVLPANAALIIPEIFAGTADWHSRGLAETSTLERIQRRMHLQGCLCQ